MAHIPAQTTVADLAAALQSLPQDAVVYALDAPSDDGTYETPVAVVPASEWYSDAHGFGSGYLITGNWYRHPAGERLVGN